MRVECKIFWLPKSGNSSEEYEDAACPDVSHDFIELPEYRCAIADGATETSFARTWARLLANGFVDQLSIPELQEEWLEEIPTENQPWYVEEKANAGAYAALLGCVIDSTGSYSCESVGDCCFIHVRDEQIVFSFPMQSPEQFGNQPILIGSKTDSGEVQNETAKGAWEAADILILASDALACWILRDSEHLKKILEIETQEKFSQLIETARQHTNGALTLHNDDVTFMRLNLND